MAEKEEILSLDEIKSKLKTMKKDSEKLSFIKRFLKDQDKYGNIRKDLIEILFDSEKPILLGVRKSEEYKLTYDSFSEGLEPVYFWILDFMRDKAPGGLGLDVKKAKEAYEASVGSGYYGEMGARITQMQQKASEYLGAINQVIKSILNLIYDLREFEMRLDAYDKMKSDDLRKREEGTLSLKGLWMDTVDTRKGRGSINALSQELNFVSLRDLFLQTPDSVSAKKLDTNDRVIAVLVQRMGQFEDWAKASEAELRNRYNLEKAYLRSQVGTLRLYANWVKPYLKAAQKLRMKEFNTPDIIHGFSNIEMELEIFGKVEVKPEGVRESFKKIKTDRKYYAVVGAKLHFRTIPQIAEGRGGRHYVHGGRIDMIFTSYSMDDIEVGALESQEFYEDMDLVDKWIGVSLESLGSEIDKYLQTSYGEKKEEKKKIKAAWNNPFAGTLKGFSGITDPLKQIFKPVPQTSFLEKETLNAAKAKADQFCYLVYYVYKKTHGMIDVDD